MDEVKKMLQQHDKELVEKVVDEMTRKFRAEYNGMITIDMEDCINWADWLEVIAEEMKGDTKWM